jgi:neutral ceramidase
VTATVAGLRAGAGRTAIVLPEDLFPIDGFDGQHDPIHARVLLLDHDGGRTALVSLELPSVREYEVDRLRDVVAGQTGTSAGQVWLGVTHTLGAPHVRSAAALADPVVARSNAAFCAALEAAVARAAADARDALAPCLLGAGTASVALNVNRDRRTPDGWTHAPEPAGFSDRTLTVLRLDTADGAPLATVFGYDLRSSVTERAGRDDGAARLVSADCTGAAARAIERAGGGVAVFVPGAMADQMPLGVPEADPDPYVQAAAIGVRLADHVLGLARDLTTAPASGAWCRTGRVDLPTADGGRTEVGLDLVVVGPAALLGLRPEIASAIGARIRAASPWPCTVVGTLVNGGAKYLVDDEARAAGTRTALASPFGPGASERLVAAALTLLDDARTHLEPR